MTPRQRAALAALCACGVVTLATVPAQAVPLGNTRLLFTAVVEKAPPPKGWLQFCKDRPGECRTEKRELRTPALTDERMAELRQVNLTVNRQVKPRTDQRNYGVSEKWTYPDNGYGDCEDYALLKKRKLVELGWPAEALLITIVWDKNAGHSLLLARTDKGEYVLDNQLREVLLWSKTRYRFVKRQSEHDPNEWVYIDGKSETPAAVASR
jgi:predicted transglutaminase-like cysteine proteinase